MAKIIGKHSDITYLISILNDNIDDSIEIARKELKSYGQVIDYPVKTSSVREGTIKSLASLKRLFTSKMLIEKVFFLDAHLVLLSVLWPFYCPSNIKQLGVVYLLGPEKIIQNSVVKYFVGKFLQRKEVVLFLRTDELMLDWQKAFPRAQIKCLPSLEIPPDEAPIMAKENSLNEIRLGILGQIRLGKGLEWIVPIFKNNSSLGQLTVAGAFSHAAAQKSLSFLKDFDGFEEKFLSESELLHLASEQDYLLMLYDDWDERMEGAVMFLAARVNRPVIVYDKGWCGRMVNKYENGMFAPLGPDDFSLFVKALPLPDSEEYEALLRGVLAFKNAHTGKSIRKAFLDVI
ncbi:MAG TPA: hypothetical protein ENH74_07185 [Methylophaga sp.]|nr:hypothetical protein [Methylophaga sp.]